VTPTTSSFRARYRSAFLGILCLLAIAPGCASSSPSSSSSGFEDVASAIASAADDLAAATGAAATLDEHVDVAAATAVFDAADVILKFDPGSKDPGDGVLIVQGLREALSPEARDEDVFRCVSVAGGKASVGTCPLSVDADGNDTMSLTFITWRVRYLTQEFSRSSGGTLDDVSLERAFSRTTKTEYPGFDLEWVPGTDALDDATVVVRWVDGTSAVCVDMDDGEVVAVVCADGAN